MSTQLSNKTGKSSRQKGKTSHSQQIGNLMFNNPETASFHDNRSQDFAVQNSVNNFPGGPQLFFNQGTTSQLHLSRDATVQQSQQFLTHRPAQMYQSVDTNNFCNQQVAYSEYENTALKEAERKINSLMIDLGQKCAHIQRQNDEIDSLKSQGQNQFQQTPQEQEDLLSVESDPLTGIESDQQQSQDVFLTNDTQAQMNIRHNGIIGASPASKHDRDQSDHPMSLAQLQTYRHSKPQHQMPLTMLSTVSHNSNRINGMQSPQTVQNRQCTNCHPLQNSQPATRTNMQRMKSQKSLQQNSSHLSSVNSITKTSKHAPTLSQIQPHNQMLTNKKNYLVSSQQLGMGISTTTSQGGRAPRHNASCSTENLRRLDKLTQNKGGVSSSLQKQHQHIIVGGGSATHISTLSLNGLGATQAVSMTKMFDPSSTRALGNLPGQLSQSTRNGKPNRIKSVPRVAEKEVDNKSLVPKKIKESQKHSQAIMQHQEAMERAEKTRLSGGMPSSDTLTSEYAKNTSLTKTKVHSQSVGASCFNLADVMGSAKPSQQPNQEVDSELLQLDNTFTDDMPSSSRLLENTLNCTDGENENLLGKMEQFEDQAQFCKTKNMYENTQSISNPMANSQAIMLHQLQVSETDDGQFPYNQQLDSIVCQTTKFNKSGENPVIIAKTMNQTQSLKNQLSREKTHAATPASLLRQPLGQSHTVDNGAASLQHRRLSSGGGNSGPPYASLTITKPKTQSVPSSATKEENVSEGQEGSSGEKKKPKGDQNRPVAQKKNPVPLIQTNKVEMQQQKRQTSRQQPQKDTVEDEVAMPTSRPVITMSQSEVIQRLQEQEAKQESYGFVTDRQKVQQHAEALYLMAPEHTPLASNNAGRNLRRALENSACLGQSSRKKGSMVGGYSTRRGYDKSVSGISPTVDLDNSEYVSRRENAGYRTRNYVKGINNQADVLRSIQEDHGDVSLRMSEIGQADSFMEKNSHEKAASNSIQLVKASHIAPRAQDGVMKSHSRIPTGVPIPAYGQSPTRAYGGNQGFVDQQNLRTNLNQSVPDFSQEINQTFQVQQKQYETDRQLDINEIQEDRIIRVSEVKNYRSKSELRNFMFEFLVVGAEAPYTKAETILLERSQQRKTQIREVAPQNLYSHVKKGDQIQESERRQVVPCFCFPNNVQMKPINSEESLSKALEEWQSCKDRGHFVFALNSNEESNIDEVDVSVEENICPNQTRKTMESTSRNNPQSVQKEPQNIQSQQEKMSQSQISDFSRKDEVGLNCICLKFIDIVAEEAPKNSQQKTFYIDGSQQKYNLYVTERVFCMVTSDSQFPIHLELLNTLQKAQELDRSILLQELIGQKREKGLKIATRLATQSPVCTPEMMRVLKKIQNIKKPLKECTKSKQILQEFNLGQQFLGKDTERYWFCPTLFRLAGNLDTLLKLFATVLLERSVICVGNDLNRVTGLIKGLQGLVRPLTWCLALVPIVPCDLIDTLEAPMPILAGVTRLEYDSLITVTMSEKERGWKTWIFLKQHPSCPQGIIEDIHWSWQDGKLPPFSFDNLHKKLSKSWQELQTKFAENQMNDQELMATSQFQHICRTVNSVVRHRLLGSLSQWTAQAKRGDIMPTDIAQLKADELVSQSDEHDKEFTEQFVTTQMFTQYIEENCQIGK